VILVDTSVWVDHLRSGEPMLAKALEAGDVMTHPFILGEIALGQLRQRDVILAAMDDLPRLSVAGDPEVRVFIERRRLFGTGIGYVDAHLLAAVVISPPAVLWTRDRRLRDIAAGLGVATSIP